MKTTASKRTIRNRKLRRNKSKLSFEGQKYGKGRFVLAAVEKYVKEHPNVTFNELKEVFPDNLHSRGIIMPLNTAKKVDEGHRFFINNGIKLKDRMIAVCSDFGINNIGKVLDHVRHELGYRVRMA